MNHNNSGTCNTGEEETEGKERGKQASKQKENWQITRRPIGQRSADRCMLAWALQNLGFCEFAFGEECKTHRHMLVCTDTKDRPQKWPLP
jgi:hypothetical protein